MIRGVIFDLDGTLFEAAYDWTEIRTRLGVPQSGTSILDHLRSLPSAESARKTRLLEEIENRATSEGRLKPGAAELVACLQGRGLRVALVTNNREANAAQILQRYELRFDVVLTRDGGSFKPSGEPLREAARRLGLSPGECAAVGDAEIDLRAAVDAAIGRVIMVHAQTERYAGRCHHVVRDLAELRDLLSEILGV